MRYASSQDFRAGLEQRLKNASDGQPPGHLNRKRRMVVFERLLARMVGVTVDQWILKGGVALDFRFGNRARFTKDLDLASDESESAIVDRIIEAAGTDLNDNFVFLLEDHDPIVIDGDKRALRFRIRAELAGRRFEIVSIDVGLGMYLTSKPESVRSSGLLEFAGIEPVVCPTIPLSQHLAEKLHAYARVYAGGRPSSRVKDLADIVLIVSEFGFSADDVVHAVRATFAVREMAPVPDRFAPPPAAWALAYREIVESIDLDPDVEFGYRIAAAFFDPLLSGSAGDDAVWSHELHEWQPRI